MKHPNVQAGIVMLTQFVDPAFKEIIKVVRMACPNLSEGSIVLHDKDGRVACVMSTVIENEKPDVDLAIKALETAIRMLETQKAKNS